MKKPRLFDLLLEGNKEEANKILKAWGDRLPPKYRKNYMAYQPQEGRGIFSPNTKKTNPMAPDWKGNIMIDGKIVRFSGWVKTSQYGEFLSLSVDKPFGEQQSYPKEVNNTYDGDIPW